jgi:hypothetical protein
MSVVFLGCHSERSEESQYRSTLPLSRVPHLRAAFFAALRWEATTPASKGFAGTPHLPRFADMSLSSFPALSWESNLLQL